jgi:hypothetical protein
MRGYKFDKNRDAASESKSQMYLAVCRPSAPVEILNGA